MLYMIQTINQLDKKFFYKQFTMQYVSMFPFDTRLKLNIHTTFMSDFYGLEPLLEDSCTLYVLVAYLFSFKVNGISVLVRWKNYFEIKLFTYSNEENIYSIAQYLEKSLIKSFQFSLAFTFPYLEAAIGRCSSKDWNEVFI